MISAEDVKYLAQSMGTEAAVAKKGVLVKQIGSQFGRRPACDWFQSDPKAANQESDVDRYFDGISSAFFSQNAPRNRRIEGGAFW